ncbi:MAG: hypothetical protein JWO81_1736 [Alphaproteobacteria bacterium]|nr:hypothetical protein [Alphaproteobacteria bacterium]
MLADLEGLDAAADVGDAGVELLLPSQSTAILADAWLGIATGSCAATRPTAVVARGFLHLDAMSQFFSTPAGLAALQTARSIVPEGAKSDPVDADRLVMQLIARDAGLVETRGGGQILFEADPDFPVASILRASTPIANEPAERRRMFTQLVLNLRRRVEIGALRRMIDPVSEGPGGAVGRFLFELHENGLEHGSRDGQGRKIRGTRMLRLRKHVSNRPDELIARHGGVAELKAYLERLNTTALVEASISDFGLGVVDGFLASPAGLSHAGRDRRELLDSLLFERLSSKGTDRASGVGIQRALRAAAQMQAFVSVRTAEFWLVASYFDGGRAFRMGDVSGPERRAKIRGTHWQILWPQP